MKIHIVQQNEKLSTIAAQYGTQLEPLLKSNPHIDEETILEVGQKIKVPSNGVKVVKNQQEYHDTAENSAPLPKWWYEEGVGKQAEGEREQQTSLEYSPPLQELPEYPYAYYPAASPNVPASVAYGYPNYPAVNDPYGAYAHIPAQPMPYGYSPYSSPSPSYERAMMILASNRIPIPPRMVNVNGIRSSKLPAAFFQMDDWNENWEEEIQEGQQN